jgi:hypothetical protein
MTKRFNQRIRAGFGSYTFLGFYVTGKDKYSHFGIEMPGITRNVHLTIGLADNAIDCHISDYNKGIRKEPWRADPLPLEELELILEDFKEPLISDYDEDDEYQEIDLSPWARIVDDLDYEGRKVAQFDLLPIFQKAMSGTLLTQRRIIDGFLDGGKPGLIFEEDIPVFVIPYEEGQMLKLDFRRDNILFNTLPYHLGFEIYMEYIEREGLLDELFKKNMPPVNEIEAAIMSAIAHENNDGRNIDLL